MRLLRASPSFASPVLHPAHDMNMSKKDVVMLSDRTPQKCLPPLQFHAYHWLVAFFYKCVYKVCERKSLYLDPPRQRKFATAYALDLGDSKEAKAVFVESFCKVTESLAEALCRFLRSKAPPSAAPVTKSALRGSPSAVPAMKSALRGSQSAVPVTKSALRGSQSAAPATKSALPGPPSAAPATKSANELHVPKSRFTAPVTKSELPDDHHHVQSAAPATKTAFRSKTAPIPCTCHEKSTLEHQTTRFPLRLPRKVTTTYENVHGTTTRAQSLEAPAADSQIQQACAVEMHMDYTVKAANQPRTPAGFSDLSPSCAPAAFLLP